MKRRFIHLTGKQGEMRGNHPWLIGPRVAGNGKPLPHVQHRGRWTIARAKAISQFSDAQTLFVYRNDDIVQNVISSPDPVQTPERKLNFIQAVVIASAIGATLWLLLGVIILALRS